MFFPGSRYYNLDTVQVTLPDGRVVTSTELHQAVQGPLLGYHQRQDVHRLDLIAANYLQDATQFWALCDVNGSVCPDALAHHRLVGIPLNKP